MHKYTPYIMYTAIRYSINNIQCTMHNEVRTMYIQRKMLKYDHYYTQCTAYTVQIQ